MSSATQYYRPPRRVPTSREEDREPQNRKRDVLFLFGGLVIITIILHVVGFILNQMGLYTIALGIQMFAVILIWVSIGVGITVGITYFVMQSFLKREFNRRFKKMDQERHAEYRRMMGLDEPNNEEE